MRQDSSWAKWAPLPSAGQNFSRTSPPAMRILQVSSPLQLGGGETHVIELTEGLRQLGHDVVVAGRKDGAVNPDVAFPFRNALDVRTVFGLRALLKKEPF